jgi:hypothetical protein
VLGAKQKKREKKKKKKEKKRAPNLGFHIDQPRV